MKPENPESCFYRQNGKYCCHRDNNMFKKTRKGMRMGAVRCSQEFCPFKIVTKKTKDI